MRFYLSLLFLCVLAPLHAAPVFETATVFEADTNGYLMYRIPGLVVTSKGTILTYAEARKTAGDWAKIDIVLRRSTDGGKSFGPMTVLSETPMGAIRNPVAKSKIAPKEGEFTMNNPVMFVEGNRIHLLYDLEYMRCFHRISEDDGVTWSKPVEITAAFEKLRPAYPWKVLATGPGHGILLKSGRLIVPIWLSTGEGRGAHRPSAVSSLFSDDSGKTWQTGEIIVNHPNLENPSETVAVEKADGSVMFNIRHECADGMKFRAVSTSPNGATGWSKPAFDKALPEPICFAAITRLGKPAEKKLLFTQPHNPTDRVRKNLTIKLSEDDGQTWPTMRVIEPGIAGYSDVISDGDKIFVFFEHGGKKDIGTQTQKLTLVRTNEEWVKGK